MDGMGRGSRSSYGYRNEGDSTSGSSQARSSSLPIAHGIFQLGSGGGGGGGVAPTLPSNSAFAGYTQSQVANIVEGAMSPTGTQSHLAAGNVPPGFWDRFQRRRLQSPAENTDRIFPSHPHGSAIPGRDIVGNYAAWVGNSPSPQLGRSYPGVAGNVPIGFVSHTNVGQNAFQVAGSPYGVQWRGYGAGPSLYQPLNYPNQPVTGGFLSAGLESHAVPVNWVDYGSRNMSGHSYQTVVPQPDASLTRGFQYYNNNNNNNNNKNNNNNNNNNTRVDQRGQSSEQTTTTTPSDFDSIQEAAVRGDYEFNYWITHGLPPSPSQASSVLRVPSGSSSGPPPSLGRSTTEQGASMANDPSVLMPKPPSTFQGFISNWQTGNVMVSSSNEAAGAPGVQNRSDPTLSNYYVQENLSERSHGSQAIPAFSSQSIGVSSRPPNRRRKSVATRKYVGASALPGPVNVRPIRSSPMAPPHSAYAGGSSSSALPGPVTVGPFQPSLMATPHLAYVGGSSSSALPAGPVMLRPIQSSPMATPRPELYAGGSSSNALPRPAVATPILPSLMAAPRPASGGPSLRFGRPPPPPQSHAIYAGSSSESMPSHDDEDDDSDSDLREPQPQDKWHRIDSSDGIPQLLGFKCELCNLDLAVKPPGTSPNAVMVHVVLPCGHCYHSSCYDEVHGFVGKDEDPPCFLCPDSGA